MFARWVFAIAGIYGLLVVAPLYFLEETIGRDQPPAITHPEFFYGFVGVTLAWQLVFLVIASDPVRYRWLMLVSIVEKWPYSVAIVLLWNQLRVPPSALVFGGIDFVLGLLFLAAFCLTPADYSQDEAK